MTKLHAHVVDGATKRWFSTLMLEDGTLNMPPAINHPESFVRECRSMGLTRAEAESSARAAFQSFFENEANLQAMNNLLFDLAVGRAKREGLPTHMINEDALDFELGMAQALFDVYGPRTQSVDSLVRFLTENQAARVAATRNAPGIESFGPILWFRVGSPDISIPRQDVSRTDSVSLAYFRESFDAFDVDAFSVIKMRRIRPRETRLQYPISLRMEMGIGSRRRGFVSYGMTIGSPNGRDDFWFMGREKCNFGHDVSFATTFSWALPRVWRADVSTGGPTVRIIIGSGEAKELFALREIPDGAKRRAALLHIVSRHERRRRLPPHEASVVRAHLRGREECSWKGCSVKIMAPPIASELAYGEAVQ